MILNAGKRKIQTFMSSKTIILLEVLFPVFIKIQHSEAAPTRTKSKFPAYIWILFSSGLLDSDTFSRRPGIAIIRGSPVSFRSLLISVNNFEVKITKDSQGGLYLYTPAGISPARLIGNVIVRSVDAIDRTYQDPGWES